MYIQINKVIRKIYAHLEQRLMVYERKKVTSDRKSPANMRLQITYIIFPLYRSQGNVSKNIKRTKRNLALK